MSRPWRTIATGLICGAFGILLVFVFFHGIWVPIMLTGGYAVTAAVYYFLLGPRRISFEGQTDPRTPPT